MMGQVIPGSHAGSPLSLEPELLADHLHIPPLNHQVEFFLTQSDGKEGVGVGGGLTVHAVPENLAGCSSHHYRYPNLPPSPPPPPPPPPPHQITVVGRQLWGGGTDGEEGERYSTNKSLIIS